MCINSLCWSLKHPAAAVVKIQPKTAKSFHIFSLQLFSVVNFNRFCLHAFKADLSMGPFIGRKLLDNVDFRLSSVSIVYKRQ